MSQKTAALYARIEPDVKEQAEAILSALGITASNAITMFYKQIILHRGLPFELVLPPVGLPDAAKLTAEALSGELEKGFADLQAGNVRPAEEVLGEIQRKYE